VAGEPPPVRAVSARLRNDMNVAQTAWQYDKESWMYLSKEELRRSSRDLWLYALQHADVDWSIACMAIQEDKELVLMPMERRVLIFSQVS